MLRAKLFNVIKICSDYPFPVQLIVSAFFEVAIFHRFDAHKKGTKGLQRESGNKLNFLQFLPIDCLTIFCLFIFLAQFKFYRTLYSKIVV